MEEGEQHACYICPSRWGSVDKKILIKNGLITDDEELIFKTLKPGKCPRCSTDNSGGCQVLPASVD